MADGDYSIAIISDQAIRGEILSSTIGKSILNIKEVPVITTGQFKLLEKLKYPTLLLIDLMGTDKSSKQIIIPLLNRDNNIKIIAMHLYRSSNLVNPLFNMGVQGYIYYEPSREELIRAIQTVLSGRKYIPQYLITA